MSLERSQREFLAAILAPAEPAHERLAIYHRGARGAHGAALEAAYPVVKRLVGSAWFAEAAARFAEAFPSRSGDLHAFGEAFARFLERYEPARELAYLPDVARLEWAVHECEQAADGASFDYAALGRIPAEALPAVRIGLRPGVRLLQSEHPVLAIWEANQGERDGTPARRHGPDRVLVRRNRLAVEPVLLDAATWALLEALTRGECLGEAAAACERAGGALDSALGQLAGLDVLDRIERPAP